MPVNGNFLLFKLNVKTFQYWIWQKLIFWFRLLVKFLNLTRQFIYSIAIDQVISIFSKCNKCIINEILNRRLYKKESLHLLVVAPMALIIVAISFAGLITYEVPMSAIAWQPPLHTVLLPIVPLFFLLNVNYLGDIFWFKWFTHSF